MANPMIDETGHWYGALEVLEKAPLPNRNKKGWRCKCHLCGREDKVFSGSDLRAGKYKSCGCKRQNIIQEQPGTMYGFLEILYEDPTPAIKFPDHCIHWFCKCHLCNSIKSISGKSLRNGETKSCGCMRSYGEQLIIQYLNNKNIIYNKEYTYPDLQDKTKLRFDFGIFQSKQDKVPLFLIEFNGIQHYNESAFQNYTHANFEKRQTHDDMKEEYCLLHNIPLYVIENKTNMDSSSIDFKLNLEFLLNYIFNDSKKEHKYGKVSYIDVRDVQSR